jgi:tetratricopeptide (TPR) repeat protein
MNDPTGQAIVAPARLLGREDAQQDLLTVLLGFDELQAPGALLVGDTGTGKTALLNTLDASVPGLLHTRARVGDRLVPYASLARWLREVLRRATQPLPPALADEFEPLLPELAGDAQTRAHLGPPSIESVHTWLGLCAPEIGGWTWDDLHLCDDATAEWLLRFLTQAPPSALPWVLSTPPPEAGSVVEALLEAAAGIPAVRSVLLGPLEPALVGQWLTDSPYAPADAAERPRRLQRLLAATGGQPLHLKLLLEPPEPTPWPPESEPLAGVLSLIGERLQRVGPQALAVARACAVGGQDASDEAVMDHLGLQPDELARAHAALRAWDLWGRDDFSHPRVREAARAATPDAQARRAHAHFAQWLESHGGHPARAAAHWQAAGEPVRALPALREAARLAQRLLSMPERMACLVRAADIAEAHGELDLAFDCCCEAFEAHTESVRHTEGEQLLAQMKRLARSPRQLARAHTQAAWHALVHGHLEAAIETGEQALALAEAEGDPALAAPARLHLGTALGVSGQLGRALALLQAAEPWVDQAVPPDERASFHGNLATVLDNLGRADTARRHHQSALALAARHSNDAHRATLLANYALSRLEAGDPIGARELAHKAQLLIERPDPEGSTAGFIAVLMAPCERSLGRYIAAMDWCDRAEHVLGERNPTRMPVAQLQRAHIWLDLGLHERALQLLTGPGAPLGRQLPPRHAVRWLLLTARAQVRLGQDPTDALAEARDRLPAEGWPELRGLLDAETALLQPGDQAATSLAAVARSCDDAGLLGVGLGVWLQCALLAAAGAPQPTLAREAAETALQRMARGIETVHADRALRWLGPSRALAACGEHQRARGLVLRGQHWLQTTAAEQVPALARQSFLELHPLNLLLAETTGVAS